MPNTKGVMLQSMEWSWLV